MTMHIRTSTYGAAIRGAILGVIGASELRAIAAVTVLEHGHALAARTLAEVSDTGLESAYSLVSGLVCSR